ncbi:MAG: autoinducer binding domain-containing protein [Fibrobacteria bacterium]|nr:autoinducer binding domain-containing protein [Fibrobacteria bacterium]
MQKFHESQTFLASARICQELTACESSDHFLTILGECAALLKADKVIALRLCTDSAETPQQINVLNHSYPQEWLDLYVSKSLGNRDPILQSHLRNGGIHDWKEVFEKNPPDPEFLALATYFGLESGLTHGLTDAARACKSLVSFARKGLGFESREKFLCELLIAPIHLAIMRLIGKQATEAPSLTEREMEVLHWIFQGKTSWEIGKLLDVSERTAKFHTSNLFRKLQVNNRAQAIGIALECGLIKPT